MVNITFINLMPSLEVALQIFIEVNISNPKTIALVLVVCQPVFARIAVNHRLKNTIKDNFV